MSRSHRLLVVGVFCVFALVGTALAAGRDCSTAEVQQAFVLPDGTVTPEIGDIHRRSARLALAVEGVAQVQIITSAQTERREAEGLPLASEMEGCAGKREYPLHRRCRRACDAAQLRRYILCNEEW